MGKRNHQLHNRDILLGMLPPQVFPAPLFPLPVVVPLTISSVALLTQNVGLLTESLIQRNVRAQTSLRGITFHPLTSSVKLCDLELRDREDKQPLLSVPEAIVKVAFPNGIFKKQPAVNLDVNANEVTVTTALYRDDGSVSSNWTKFANSFEDMSQTDGTLKEEYNGNVESSSSAFTFSCTIHKPQVILQNSKYQAIAPRITLPKFHITSERVHSIVGVANLVDSIVTRVIRESKPRAFHSDARDLVGTWIKNKKTSSSQLVDKAITWSRLNVPLLRSKLQQIDYIVEEVPGLQDVRSLTSGLDGVLQGIERLLKHPQQQQPDDSFPPSALGDGGSGSNSKRAGTVSSKHEQQRQQSPSTTVEKSFRELDED